MADKKGEVWVVRMQGNAGYWIVRGAKPKVDANGDWVYRKGFAWVSVQSFCARHPNIYLEPGGGPVRVR